MKKIKEIVRNPCLNNTMNSGIECVIESLQGISNVHSVVISVNDHVHDSVRVSVGSSVCVFVKDKLK